MSSTLLLCDHQWLHTLLLVQNLRRLDYFLGGELQLALALQNHACIPHELLIQDILAHT
jgi:hypothetical protein